MAIEISKKQAEYIRNSSHRWNIKMGATQSGKTYLDTLYLIPQRILERKNQEGLNFIVGVTKETIERNVLSKMRSIWGVHNVSEINNKNRAIIFGEIVYCIGAQDKGQTSIFRGATIKYLYIDEFPDISKDVFDIFPSRLSMAYSCADLTGNPKHPKHWSEDFIHSDKDIYFQRYTLYDNPFLTKEVIQNIERDYRNTVYFDRYVLGLPKRAEGLVFPYLADNLQDYIISADKLPKRYDFVEAGFDIGGNGSAYAITTTMYADGKIYVLRAKKKQAQDVQMSDVLQFVTEMCNSIKSKYGFDVECINCDHISVIVNTIVDNSDYRAELCYKPSIEERPFLISKYIAEKRIFFVEGECEDLTDEMTELVFDEKADKAIPLDDGTMQIDSWDSFIYSISSNWSYLRL